MYVILVYDIICDEKGRKKYFQRYLKFAKKYLVHIQKLCFFEGNLSKANSLALQKELDVYIRKDKDSVIMFHTREERWMNKDFSWKKTDDKTSNFFVTLFIVDLT